MSRASTSSQQAAWRRLKKNKGAIAGLIITILALFTAIFSYFIAPDSSPYANRIILEIRKQKPGFKKTFLKVPKETNTNGILVICYMEREMSLNLFRSIVIIPLIKIRSLL